LEYSRRDLSLLPLLALAGANAASAADTVLPSKPYRFEDLPVKVNGKNRSFAVFDGVTHSGFHVDMHMTELGPGEAPHPPHHHVHEEIIMVKEGSLEVTISGKITNVGPGSTTYVASNEEHGWRNVGSTKALYFVLALGRETA
jgi:quercetin dioxygenase-like cupin family protein